MATFRERAARSIGPVFFLKNAYYKFSYSRFGFEGRFFGSDYSDSCPLLTCCFCKSYDGDDNYYKRVVLVC